MQNILISYKSYSTNNMQDIACKSYESYKTNNMQTPEVDLSSTLNFLFIEELAVVAAFLFLLLAISAIEK